MSWPRRCLVERGAGVVLGQHALERRVVALDAGHRVVDELADGGLAGLRLQVRPARLGRHPEDVLGAVLVGVLGVGALRLLGHELRVLLLEGVGDVLEEDQAEDDVLVLGGVHAAAQRVGHLPELGFVADGGAAVLSPCTFFLDFAIRLALSQWLGALVQEQPETAGRMKTLFRCWPGEFAGDAELDESRHALVAVGNVTPARRHTSFRLISGRARRVSKTRSAVAAVRRRDRTCAASFSKSVTSRRAVCTALAAASATASRKKSTQASHSPSLRTRSSRR